MDPCYYQSMLASFSQIFLLGSLLFLPWGLSAATPGATATISAPFASSTITIRANQRFGGAIDSLIWRGKEFINSFDHGRLLQSSVSFDGFGECFNPNEGGSRFDGAKNTSTSVWQNVSVLGTKLITETQMAFWLRPDETGPCHGGVTVAQNQTPLSNHWVKKTTTIGFAGIPNVIEHQIKYTVPTDYTSATFEALTAYLPADFSSFSAYNPATNRLEALSDGPGEQSLPVIISTPDGAYALGIYSPDLPHPNYPKTGYGRRRFNNPNPLSSTVKWNCVFRRGITPAGTYSYRCYSAIGTLTDVTAAFEQLHKHFQTEQALIEVLAEKIRLLSIQIQQFIEQYLQANRF